MPSNSLCQDVESIWAQEHVPRNNGEETLESEWQYYALNKPRLIKNLIGSKATPPGKIEGNRLDILRVHIMERYNEAWYPIFLEISDWPISGKDNGQINAALKRSAKAESQDIARADLDQAVNVLIDASRPGFKGTGPTPPHLNQNNRLKVPAPSSMMRETTIQPMTGPSRTPKASESRPSGPYDRGQRRAKQAITLPNQPELQPQFDHQPIGHPHRLPSPAPFNVHSVHASAYLLPHTSDQAGPFQQPGPSHMWQPLGTKHSQSHVPVAHAGPSQQHEAPLILLPLSKASERFLNDYLTATNKLGEDEAMIILHGYEAIDIAGTKNSHFLNLKLDLDHVRSYINNGFYDIAAKRNIHNLLGVHRDIITRELTFYESNLIHAMSIFYEDLKKEHERKKDESEEGKLDLDMGDWDYTVDGPL